MFGTYKNRSDPRCLCEFHMIGIMTEHPEEETIHNKDCPVHQIYKTHECKCVIMRWEGKDAYNNPIQYQSLRTNGCKIHPFEDYFDEINKPHFRVKR